MAGREDAGPELLEDGLQDDQAGDDDGAVDLDAVPVGDRDVIPGEILGVEPLIDKDDSEDGDNADTVDGDTDKATMLSLRA